MACSGDKNNCDCGCITAKAVTPDNALIVQLPILIKASLVKGKRIIDFEASCASLDYEGDVITQDALLKSAEYFLSEGFIDVDHYAELGKNPAYSWLGIRDPDSWIVGKPLDVVDLGNYRTGVKAEIKQHPKGDFKPLEYKYDWLWQQLGNEQGSWKASVFGYPGADTEEGGCTFGTDGHICATRYLVKSFRWHSTALTRNPINKSLKHPVQIITAKAFAQMKAPKLGNVDLDILKSEKFIYRDELRKSYFTHLMIDCPETSKGSNVTTFTVCNHYMKCENLPYHLSDVYALATSELIRRIS